MSGVACGVESVAGLMSTWDNSAAGQPAQPCAAELRVSGVIRAYRIEVHIHIPGTSSTLL